MKAKFFDFEKELKELNINLHNGSGVLAIITSRGTGKTYSTFNYVINDCLKNNYLFVVARTTAIEAENFPKYLEQTHQELFVKNECIYVKETNKLIGFIVSINASTKTKSMFENNKDSLIKYFIYDEFNDIKERKDIYENYINLLISVKRNNPNFWAIMLGNKDSQNNTFLVNWGIRFKDQINGRYHLDLHDRIGVHYVEYDHTYFSGVNTADNLISKLSSVNSEMDRFINKGGFRKTTYDNIINYNVWILPTRKIYYYLLFRHSCFECGIFEDTFLDKKNCMYIHEIELDERDKRYNTYAFNEAYGFGTSDKDVLDEDDLVDIAETIRDYDNANRLYFTSFNTFITTTQEIYIILRYILARH